MTQHTDAQGFELQDDETVTSATPDAQGEDELIKEWAKSIGFGVVVIPKTGEQWLNPALSGRYDMKDLRFWYEQVGSPKPHKRPDVEREAWSVAMSIVNPILDLANIDVVKRQEINDRCDDIVIAEISTQREQARQELLDEVERVLVITPDDVLNYHLRRIINAKRKKGSDAAA